MDLPDRNEQTPKTVMLKLLLLEDDPVSRAFLTEVLSGLPAAIECAESCAQAESLANAGTHALWLFDANLPDGSGADLLRRLRAMGRTTPAIAMTAEAFRERLQALSAAGFVEVLEKPIAATALQARVRSHLDGVAATPVVPAVAPAAMWWDEPQALAAVGGKTESMRALRELFLGELPSQLENVRSAFGAADHAGVRDHLHRLKASCGFVGASRLLAAVNRLSVGMDPASLEYLVDSAAQQLRAAAITNDAA